MGMLAVVELASKVEAGEMSLTDALCQHLTTGFFKATRYSWISICVNIIEKYRSGDTDLSYKVNVPDKDFTVVAESVVENLHLEAFMEIGE